MLFVLAVPLVLLPTPVLVGTAVLGAGGLPVLSQLARAHLPAPRLDNPSFRVAPSRIPFGLGRELLITWLYPVAVRGAGTAWAWRRAVRGCARRSSPPCSPVGGGSGARRGRDGRLGAAARTGRGSRVASRRRPRRPGWTRTTLHACSLPPGPDGTDADLHVVVARRWTAPHSSTPLDLARTTGSTARPVIGVMLRPRHRAAILRCVTAATVGPCAARRGGGDASHLLHAARALPQLPGRRRRPRKLGARDVIQVVTVLLLGLAWRATAGRGPLEDARLRRRHPRRPPGRRLTGKTRVRPRRRWGDPTVPAPRRRDAPT